MHRAISICGIALLLLIPAIAGANQLDLFGFNSRATSLGNAYTALADGPEATFYNPAALIESKSIRAFGGYGFALPLLSLDRQRRNGSDISDTDAVRDAESPQTGQFVNAGVSGGIYDRVFFGLGMQVPVDGASRRKIFSPDRPFYLDYDTGIFGLTFLPAVAVQLAPNYGLGIAARVTMDPFGTMTTDVPTAVGDYQSSTMAKNEFNAQAAPIIGFYARTHEFLRFALVYSGQSYSYYQKKVRQKLVPSEEEGFVGIEYEARYNFIPRRLTLGIAGEPDEHVLLTAEISWVNWANYTPPYPEVQLDFSHMNEAGIPYERPDVIQRDDVDLDFNDTFVPRFGIEIIPYKYLSLRLGYALEPAALDVQQGTTNIMDSTTHALSFGLGANFGGPRGDLVNIDFAIMDHIMTERWASKNSDDMEEANPETNPAWPRYEVSGQALYSSLTATFHF